MMEELQKYLEPKMMNSYNIFTQVSKPKGYADSFCFGMKIGYQPIMDAVGCELIDCGYTQLGVLVLRFTKDGQNYTAMVGESESTGEVKFKLDKRTETWETML